MYIIDKKVSADYKDLLSRLINVKPENRLRLADIRKHPWFVSFARVNSFGINVGFDKIPIDEKVVLVMEGLGFPPVQTRRYLEYNIKNECTTTYYLFLKKNFKLGLASAADICSEDFNEELVHKAIKKKRHKSIDFNALVERSEANKQIADTNSSNAKFQDRKCRSVMRNIMIDTHSVGRASFDSRADNNSIKVHFRRYNMNNLTSTSKSRDDKREGRALDIQSLL
uniref:Protein kinase domain-containing protein n=1 Tax=Nymphaea colorata TaxID=210225 RepID=A0A5K1HAI5_9MAGN|nr:unnamed protein product [Nymphaea colorata]